MPKRGKEDHSKGGVDPYFDQRLLEGVSILQIQNEANEAEVRLTQECGHIIENLKKTDYLKKKETI